MHELFGTVLDRVSDIIFVREAGGRIIYGNQAFLQLFAPARRSAIIGTEHPDDFIAADLACLLTDGLAPASEADLVQGLTDWSGRVRFVRVRRHTLGTPSGQRLILSVAADVTELVLREQALVRAAGRLREWASVASHDLRSPIGSYVTAIAIIQDDPENTLSAPSQQYLGLVADSAASLVQQLTAMISRECGGRQPDDMTADCDLNLILAEVRANLAPLLAQGRVALDVARLPTLQGDRTALRRLFMNLLEFALRRRGRDQARIVLRYEQVAGEHRFALEDNGRAMASEARDALVHPFLEGAPIGAGIGLAECQRAVARHGGSIAVDPAFAGGCRIRIFIPVGSAARAGVIGQVA